jgi:hypothetical protein
VSVTVTATPPANVTNLTATALSATSVKLDWTNPADADFAGVRVCRAYGDTAPTLPCAGINLAKPTATFTDNNNLIPNTEYTYAVFAYDNVGSVASGSSATVTTDALPVPANVSNLTATALSSSAIQLDWTNPDDPNFAGVLICGNIGTVAPTTPCSGVILEEPTDTYTDEFHIFAGTPYSYTVFALNASGDPASGVSVTVTTPDE